MALCNHSAKEVSFKIVYCGTPGGGKTTNLEYIHRKLDPHFRGELNTLIDAGNRAVCFDFLPVKSSDINGYRSRLNLYTAPTLSICENSGSSILEGADGIVFVADSDPVRLTENVEAYQHTRQALEMSGLDPDGIPLVLQFNKRDLRDAMAPELMDEMLAEQRPAILTCATSGYQVIATLDHITQIVLKNFHSSAVNGRERIEEENVASSSKIALSR
ncbi:MAG: Rab family GTPase [Verrucomicrobiales bacterium]|nr:Rab family GTPase [Verrucomicrobiales bacterium]